MICNTHNLIEIPEIMKYKISTFLCGKWYEWYEWHDKFNLINFRGKIRIALPFDCKQEVIEYISKI